jgi:hypothetical protein
LHPAILNKVSYAIEPILERNMGEDATDPDKERCPTR